MQLENARYYRGSVIAYRFTKGEMQTIIDALRKYRPLLLKKIEKIENHPKNEGQATYACKVDEITGTIQFIDELCLDGLNSYDPTYYTDKELKGYYSPESEKM